MNEDDLTKLREEINYLHHNKFPEKKAEIKVCSLDEMKNLYILCKQPLHLSVMNFYFPDFTEDNNYYNQMIEIFEKSFTGRNSEHIEVNYSFNKTYLYIKKCCVCQNCTTKMLSILGTRYFFGSKKQIIF